MSRSASVAFEFLREGNASESNGTVANGSASLKFGPAKHQSKPRCMQDLLPIKSDMMLKLLSSIEHSKDKKVDFAHVNRQGEGFNGQSEALRHKETMELFPGSIRFGSNPRVTETNITFPFAVGLGDPNSRSVLAKAPEQPSTAQLTIFYNGAVNVYDMPAEKAQAIMKFASANSSNNRRTSTITTGKIGQVLQEQPSKSSLNVVHENQPEKPLVGLEIVRKLSLRRFLEKRKERVNSVGPYTTMKTAALPSEEGKDSDDKIILSLGCPRPQS